MKVLITTTHLQYYAGSELVALEIAEYFASRKDSVTIFTHRYDDPIKQVVESESYKTEFPNLRVTTDFNCQIDPNDVDLLWVQHGVVPPNILKLFTQKSYSKPFIVFHHMSSIYDYRFFIDKAETALADKIFAVSDGTKDTNENNPRAYARGFSSIQTAMLFAQRLMPPDF